MNFLKFRWTSLLARLYVQIAVTNQEDFISHTHTKKPGWWTWYAYMSLPYICYLNFWLKTIFYHHISFLLKHTEHLLRDAERIFQSTRKIQAVVTFDYELFGGKVSDNAWRGNLLDFCFLIGVKSINNDDRTRTYDMI